VELGVVEAEDDELNRSNCHLDPPYSLENDASCTSPTILRNRRARHIIQKG